MTKKFLRTIHFPYHYRHSSKPMEIQQAKPARFSLILPLQLTMIFGGVSPVLGGDFFVSSQTELSDAIVHANSSSDASSTITMNGNFTVAPGSLPEITTNLHLNTAGYALTSSSGNLTFSIADGKELVVAGTVLTSGNGSTTGALLKSGGGVLVFSGGNSTVRWYVGASQGNIILKDGAKILYDDTYYNNALAQDGATVTVSGNGTTLTSKFSLKLHGTLNIEDGGAFSATSYASPAFEAATNALINVTGAGSSFQSGGLRVSRGHLTLNVLDGGSLSGSMLQVGGTAGLNASATGLVDQGGSADIMVSDPGSVISVVNPLLLMRGSLSVLNGGVVNAGGFRVGSFDRAVIADAVGTALVSGAGSRLATTQNTSTSFIVGGGDGAGLKDGTLTIADMGHVSVASGAGTINVAITADSFGTINIGGETGSPAAKAGTIEAASIQFGAGTGALHFNHDDENYDFTVPLLGAGTISQIGSGKTTLSTNQSGFTGETLVSAGILAVNDRLGGTMHVINGRLQGIGTVGDTVNESGGIIAPGNSIGTLTIDGDYSGNGGLLEIETVLGGDNSSTDKLIITGNATGTTNIHVINDNGSGAPTVEGIRIIEVGGISNSDAFSLQSSYQLNGQKVVVAGAYAYALYQGGVTTPDDGAWYLRSTHRPIIPPVIPGVDIELPPDDTDPGTTPGGSDPGTQPGGSDPGTQPGGSDPGTPPHTGGGNPLPLYQAGIPVYEAYAQSLLLANGLPTLQQRVGNRYWSDQQLNNNGSFLQNGIWGRVEGSHNRFHPASSKTLDNYDADIWKMQAGLDGLLAESESGLLIGGVTVQYSHIKSDAASKFGDGSIQTDGYGIGGTLTWYGTNGFYIDGQAMGTWYRSDLSSDTVNTALGTGNHGFGYALSAETGQRFTLSEQWSLTPQVQFVYSSVDLDAFKDGFGSSVSFDNVESLLGRLGIAANYETSWTSTDGTASRVHAYAIANLYQEFLDGSRLIVSGTDFSTRNERTWGGLGAGGSYDWADGKYKLYGEASLDTSLQDFGDSYRLKGIVGFKVAF